MLAAEGRALLEVGVIAAAVDAIRVLGQVEFEHAGHAACQELTIVADEHDATAKPANKRLEAFEAVEIELALLWGDA